MKAYIAIVGMIILHTTYLQPDQINMVVLFWFVVKKDVGVTYCTVAYTCPVLQGTKKNGHV